MSGKSRVVLILAIVVVAALAGVGWWWYQLQSAAVRWNDAKEIYSQSITRDGAVWVVSIESLIDRPAYLVWEAMKQPERSSEFIDAFRKSELIADEENRKVIRMAIQVLTLPVITFDAEFRYDEATHRATMKSLGTPAQEVDATYEIIPSPDETKCMVRYNGRVTNRVQVPLPENVQRGAMQELVVKTIRALHKGIERGEQEAREAAAKWEKVEEIASETIQRDAGIWKVGFESKLAAPPDKVWQALTTPAQWAGSSPALEKVTVEKDESAQKTIKVRGKLLSLPAQSFRAEISYDEAAKSARIKTVGSPLLELDATYRIEPSPDGGTLVHYQATATERVKVPPPEDVARGAIRQLYVETVRGLMRVAAPAAAPATTAPTPSST